MKLPPGASLFTLGFLGLLGFTSLLMQGLETLDVPNPAAYVAAKQQLLKEQYQQKPQQ